MNFSDWYQKLPSLKKYVLVERDRAYVDVFSRAAKDWDAYQSLEGLSEVLRLPVIDFEIPLKEIYRGVIES